MILFWPLQIPTTKGNGRWLGVAAEHTVSDEARGAVAIQIVVSRNVSIHDQPPVAVPGAAAVGPLSCSPVGLEETEGLVQADSLNAARTSLASASLACDTARPDAG